MLLTTRLVRATGGADGADDTSAVASALTASKAAARALLRGVVAAVADNSVGVETASATAMQAAASVVEETASATAAAARVLAVSAGTHVPPATVPAPMAPAPELSTQALTPAHAHLPCAPCDVPAECEVPQQVSVTVPLPDEATDNVVMGGVAFVAVAVAVLARVALCRRAWGELPVYDQKVNGRWTTANGQAPRSNPVLAPNWRNRFVLCATLADGFMCAAPAFLPHVRARALVPHCTALHCTARHHIASHVARVPEAAGC